MMPQKDKDRMMTEIGTLKTILGAIDAIEYAREEVPVRRCVLLRMKRRLSDARRARDLARQEVKEVRAAFGFVATLGALRWRESLDRYATACSEKDAEIHRLKAKRGWLARVRDRLGLWR